MLACWRKHKGRRCRTDSSEHEKMKKLNASRKLHISGSSHRLTRNPELDFAHRSYPLPIPDDPDFSASFPDATNSRRRGHVPVIQNPVEGQLIQNPVEGQLIESSTSNPAKWKKVKLLGKGTFANVYLGVRSDLPNGIEHGGLMCVIKEFKVAADDEQSSRESLAHLSQEINLLANLSHANIVCYYGSELIPEGLSAYFECVRGVSIHKLLQEYGAFAEPVIQNYTRQILSCLAYLFGQNIVHRDIKGANILVDMNGEIRFTEFGMAMKIRACSSTKMTPFNGSSYWMAPEVVNNSSWYGHTVDIWSLGCTVIEMASSKPPWSQYEEVEAILKIGHSTEMPEIPYHLSTEAKKFISLCLRREPSARPLAYQLLHHPFLRNPSPVTRETNMKITREAFSNLNGICSPWGF